MIWRRPVVEAIVPGVVFLVLACLVCAAFAVDWFRADLPGRRVMFGPLEAAPGLWGFLGCAVIVVGLIGWLLVAARDHEHVAVGVMVAVIAVAGTGVGMSLATLAWGVSGAVAQVPSASPAVPLRTEHVAYAATGALSAIAAGMCEALRRTLP